MGACCKGTTQVESVRKPQNIDALGSNYAAQQLSKSAIEDDAERKRVEEIWKKFDTNNNGSLDRSEGKAFLQQELETMTGQPPTDEEIERNFNIIDEDGNGTLDKEEVLKFLKGFGLGFTLRNLMR